jgi:hypothetical protein
MAEKIDEKASRRTSNRNKVNGDSSSTVLLVTTTQQPEANHIGQPASVNTAATSAPAQTLTSPDPGTPHNQSSSDTAFAHDQLYFPDDTEDYTIMDGWVPPDSTTFANQDVNSILVKLNDSIIALSSSMARSMHAMRIDIKTAQQHQEAKMESFEAEFRDKQAVLKTQVDEKLTQNDKLIRLAIMMSKKSKADIVELRAIINNQQATIEALTDSVATNCQNIEINAETSLQAIQLANSVEAHQRRWSVRIIGLDEPEIKTSLPTGPKRSSVISFTTPCTFKMSLLQTLIAPTVWVALQTIVRQAFQMLF